MVDHGFESVAPADPIDLRDRNGYLRIPLASVRVAGFASRTLGALLECIDRRTRTTFAGIDRIAEVAMLPRRTVQRHLARLGKLGFVQNRGRRDHRRMPDRVVSADVKSRPFVPLPRWWIDFEPARAMSAIVYGCILSDWCKMATLHEREDVGGEFGDGYFDHLAEFTMRGLAELTGRDRRAVGVALRDLEDVGLVHCEFGLESTTVIPLAPH